MATAEIVSEKIATGTILFGTQNARAYKLVPFFLGKT
jgi:hypothetical protein